MEELDDDTKLMLEDDLALFESMKDNYISENECIFFETLRYKEIYEFTGMYEMMMLETDNDISFYFIRQYWNEYGIGISGKSNEHFQSLKETLECDMFDLGLSEHILLLEWLRKRDYVGIHYDRNNDLE